MKGTDPEFLEAARLIRKFFPESKGWITDEVGLDWDAFLSAMQTADYAADYSCDLFRHPDDPDYGLSEQGGLAGNATEIYKRLLTYTSLNPSGRAVVVPDALGRTAWSIEECPPFVCSTNTICERLNGITFFGQSQDSIFVYESGEALLIDHHSRVHWSRSQRN